jgi:hypothetical protein
VRQGSRPLLWATAVPTLLLSEMKEENLRTILKLAF